MTIERCLAMPLPVSGICLFGINEIVYLNQSIPPCGISLNSNADEFSKFPLNNCRDLRITLDACAFQAISSSEIFVVLRTGSLFHLTLDIDPSNAVRGLVMRKVYGRSFFLIFKYNFIEIYYFRNGLTTHYDTLLFSIYIYRIQTWRFCPIGI
jgi:hypothetical protein